ncbi:hypothetical protein BDZ94DRAFT_1254812 [Collybia nuda]|uniref:Secreted protein n=1 Tax=Collybia nuda TaxID=64659 RepID=A0A9P5YCM2_9AGAR|nr:hypothetical protein BDZ94DRAFT_1254812 [Collybia nuda]
MTIPSSYLTTSLALIILPELDVFAVRWSNRCRQKSTIPFNWQPTWGALLSSATSGQIFESSDRLL